MKKIICSDLHGRTLWKKIVAKEKGKVIILGDYFDSFDIHSNLQIQNFLDIIEFKKNNDCILLVGNHDWNQYVSLPGESSGYDAIMAPQIREVLVANKEHLQAAYYEDGWLFTHAGVSTFWLENNGIEWKTGEELADKINKLFLENPLAFAFNGSRKDVSGTSPQQGPFWIRPETLINYTVPFNQVIGHTVHKEPQILKVKNKNIICLDTCNNHYLIINKDKWEVEKIDQ